MSTTQPIRDMRAIQALKDYYRTFERNPRNYTLIVIGLNTALRISDILHLTWDMVSDGGRIRRHLSVTEQKTGKENRILLNEDVRLALQEYLSYIRSEKKEAPGNAYLFPSPYTPGQPLSRSQSYRIICHAARKIGLEDHISCHSLRKTFGYCAWKQGTQPALLMLIFNHSSFDITMRYLCIEQDDKDAVFAGIRLGCEKNGKMSTE